MIFSLVAMTGLEKCCITSAYLQWLCHSGERPVALVLFFQRKCDLTVHVNPRVLLTLKNTKKKKKGAAVVIGVLFLEASSKICSKNFFFRENKSWHLMWILCLVFSKKKKKCCLQQLWLAILGLRIKLPSHMRHSLRKKHERFANIFSVQKYLFFVKLFSRYMPWCCYQNWRQNRHG